MTDAIYSWMQNLVCYFILLSAVMNFLPDNSYKKYIQYYMGLLLILVILAPVFQYGGIQEKIDEYVAEFQITDYEKEDWRQKAEEWEDRWNEQITVIEGQEVVP